MSGEKEKALKQFPRFDTDEEAERFVETADLSEYDFSESQALHEKWLKHDPAYAAEHQAMEPEFAIAAELIRARIKRARPLESSARDRHHLATETAAR